MRAFLTLPERLEIIAKLCIPYSFMLVLLLLDITAVPHPLSLMTQAPFIFMAVYYWSIYRPDMLPVWLVFLGGLILDIFSSAPLGMNALLYMTASLLLVSQQRFMMGQSFFILWLGFIIVSSAVLCLQWLLMSVLYLQFLPLSSLGPPIILGALFFPLISAFLHLTHKIL